MSEVGPHLEAVIFVIQGADVSGAERMHADLVRSDPDALVACPEGTPAETFARSLGATTASLPFRPLRHSGGLMEGVRSVARGLATARDLRRVLKAHPDRKIVFCTSIRPGMVAALASLGLRRKLLWCIPDFLPPAPLRQVVRLMIRHSAHRTLCLSRAIEDDLCGPSEALRALSTVVYPGVEAARFDASVGDPGGARAAVLGQISYVKRTDLAIEIAERVLSDHPGFSLRVVGRAQFRDEDFVLERELRARAASDPRLGDAIEFPGFAEDVGAALGGCAMLLHTRPDEPFGIAMIEAMAMSLPVVAPAAAGPLEIVEHEVTGLLYEPGDAAAGAAAVGRLLDDPEGASRMGAAGRRRVEERFGIERQLAETRALLAR